MSTSFSLVLFVALFSTLLLVQANVPSSKQFKYVNEGSLGEYVVEYGDYRPLEIGNFPFLLCFYNATPNAFLLGIRMGHRRSESIMRWVWDANRGKPVRDNATLTFGRDGNLLLADVDGTVAWQTNTANEGVVGLDLLSSGNLVLYDKKGKYIWQSFDHPTDTLLIGQSLRATGPNRLVSRLDEKNPYDGPYSFVMEKRHWALYYQPKSSPKPLPYYKADEFGNGKGALSFLTFYCEAEYGANHAFELGFSYNMSNSNSFGRRLFSRPKYNSTYSMLRLDIDGNLRIYTYEEYVDWDAWETTFVLLNREDGVESTSECKLPKKCGAFGVCEGNQCVACPTPRGLLGWTKACSPPILPPPKGGAAKVDYYKVEGVEHFTSAYEKGDGPMSIAQCRDKCSKDWQCVGFFYRRDSSKCLVVPELGTLIKVSNPSQVGYIKISK